MCRRPLTRFAPPAYLAQLGAREIYLYCASGLRSGLAARILASEGCRAFNTGGLSDWADTRWPIVPPARHH